MSQPVSQLTGVGDRRRSWAWESTRRLNHWEERRAAPRTHGTTKRQVAAMFAEGKPFLLPLPEGSDTVELQRLLEDSGLRVMRIEELSWSEMERETMKSQSQ